MVLTKDERHAMGARRARIRAVTGPSAEPRRGALIMC
jgi:hypothetical protein